MVHAGSITYPISVWWETSTQDCAAHSHGAPVVQYLTAHPCANMTRQLVTTTVDGRGVGFNVANIAFLGNAPQVYTTAGNFRTLVLANGTGDVNDLLAEGYRLPSGPTALPQPDAFTALGEDSDVTVYDIWFLNGPTPNNDPALLKMAQDVFLQY